MIRLATCLGLAVAAATATTAAIPDYVNDALAAYSARLPATWACSVEVRRDGAITVERYDPAKPAGAQWRLDSVNGAPPTASDLTAYARHRGRPGENPFRSAFDPDQLDRASFQIVHETAGTATVRFGFSADAARADKMLPQLELELLIRRQPAGIVNYRLRLPRPFTPVIAVKMHSLEAGADFDPLGRPTRQFSRFSGRLFLLKSIREDLETRFFDYTPAGNG